MAFVTKLRNLVALTRKGGGKGKKKAEKEKEETVSEDEDSAGESADENEEDQENAEIVAGDDSELDDEDAFFSSDWQSYGGGKGKSESKNKDLLVGFFGDEETGLNSTLRFAIQKIFLNTKKKDVLTLDDESFLADTSQSEEESNAPSKQVVSNAILKSQRLFSKNPFFHLSSLVGGCLDKNLHLLIKRDFITTLKQLEECGSLPETVSPNSPLCRSADYRAPKRKGRLREMGEQWHRTEQRGVLGGSSRKGGPACWGLPHTVFGIDRQRLKVLRDSIESAEGCQRAFQFSLTLSEFSSDDLDTLEMQRRTASVETFLLSTMLSIQRTSLGCLSSRLSTKKGASNQYQSLVTDIPAVLGMQEDVLVSGSNLAGALATFVQHLLLQIQDLMDTKLHVVEGLYVTDTPIHPATFSVNQFDISQSNLSRKRSKTEVGIRFGLTEMFDTLEEGTTKTSLTFVKAVKRAVLQQKIITLSVVLHVTVDPPSSHGKKKETLFSKRLIRLVKRYVFHHDGTTQDNYGPDSVAHYSGDPFEAIYSGIFLSQKAVRRYMQLYQYSPMDAVVFEPNLARRKDVISEFLSESDVRPALCETLSFALLEWSQDVYNTQGSVSSKQLNSIVEVIVNGPSKEEDAIEEFDEYHMSLLSAVAELVLLDSSLSSQLTLISQSADVVIDVLFAELQDSAGVGDVSFLKDSEEEDAPIEKGKGFEFVMDHVQEVVKCLGKLEKLGIVEIASSGADSQIVRDNLLETSKIVNKDPSHTFLLINQLCRASHLIKSCGNVLSSGFWHELTATKSLLTDLRSRYLSTKKRTHKHDKGSRRGRHKESSQAVKKGIEMETNGEAGDNDENHRMAYPIAVSSIEKAQPGIIENLQIAASSGLNTVLGGLVWNLLQPPIPIDPYPKCIKILKGAASALEVSALRAGQPNSSSDKKNVFQVANQLVMLANDRHQIEHVNALFPVYLAGDIFGNSSDAVYGSYTALQYCGIESVSTFVKLLMEQVLTDIQEDDEEFSEVPSSSLWHLFGTRSFHRGTCKVDIVQSVDGSMSIDNLASILKARKGGEIEFKNEMNVGIQTVREYYLIKGNSKESMRTAAEIFADDIIEHIRAFVVIGQSHVLENTDTRKKGGLILDIQVNHPDFMYKDKQKLLSRILSSYFLESASVQSHEDPFHRLLEKAAYSSISNGKTEQIVSILIAQEHPILGYVPVVKSIHLSYCDTVDVRVTSIPEEAHSQIFVDDVSALTWHNWFDKVSYPASCSEFIQHLTLSKSNSIERVNRNAQQLTSSLYTLRLFTKAYDSQTQLYMDTLRACTAVQDIRGIERIGKLLSSECYSSISKIMTSAILLEAFLDGKSIHIEQVLTTDMHGEMLKRLKLVLEGLIGNLKDILKQDWVYPLSRPIETFIHKSAHIKDTIMKGSFDYAVSHVKSVLMWGIECSNYISSAIEISSGEQVESILERIHATASVHN